MADLTTDDEVKKYVIYAKEGSVTIKVRKNLKYIEK